MAGVDDQDVEAPESLLDHREFPVLYVDDEPENLRIFELTFKRQLSILTAQSAAEGLQVINENPVAVVLSDQRMPGMTGIEVLRELKAIHPFTEIMILTAYESLTTLVTDLRTQLSSENTVIGRLFTIEQMRDEMGYDAVFVGTGAGFPSFMGIPRY